jgi:type IV secretory pathway TraG/TraD family ATPase VirD4
LIERLIVLRATVIEWTGGWKGVAVALGTLLFAVAFFLRRGPASRDVYKRGAKILEGRRARCKILRLSKSSGESSVTLAGVRIAASDETKHFKLIGTTGAGKSTATRELLRCALERGDRAIITDPDGGYLLSFYDRYRGDVVLNPFEKHAVKWNPFTEIRELYDVDQLAGGLIPATEDASGREWRGHARTFLAAVIRRCHQSGPHDVAELWRLLAIAPSSELRPIVYGTPAQPFLEPDNARMFGSIRSVAGSAAAALAYIKEQRALSFSVRNWVQSGRGVLFIPYNAGQIPALRSIIATWMRLAIVETMSHPEEDRRLWFVVDELDTLGAIDGLKDALTRLRRFGGRCVLGFQSVAQVSNTYGAGEAQALAENCGHTLILRCSGSENGGTSQFASRLIGEREIVRRQMSRGRDRKGFFASRGSRRSTNISEHVMEAAVMPAELERLPDLTGYLKTTSCDEWLRVTFPR